MLRAISMGLCAAALTAFARADAADFGVDQPRVRSIEILGNRSFDDGALAKRMRTKEARFWRVFRQPRFRRDFLRRDIDALASFYRTNGFLSAAVTLGGITPDGSGKWVTIRLLVNEGPRTVVRSLSFAGEGLPAEPRLRRGLKLVEGAPYNPNLLEVDRYTIFGALFETGRLAALVTYDAAVDSNLVDIRWTIEPGDPVNIREVRVAGNRRVNERFLRRELTFKRGEAFSTAKVLGSKQNLYDTGCFTSVEIEPDTIDASRHEVDLLCQVRERKMGYIETGFGAGNVHGNRVFAEWGQRNLLGRGYVLNFNTAHAFRLFPNNEYSWKNIDFRSKYMRHRGEIQFPHILGTWNTFSLGASYERDATVEPVIIKDLSFAARVSRRFTRQSSLVLGYTLERVQRLEIEEEKSRSRRRSIDLTFSRDTRDFYFNPQRGTCVTAEGRYTGGLLGGEDNYYSTVGAVQGYQGFGKLGVLACRLRAGYAEAFGSSSEAGLPIESRFFAGGGNSVRGFEENSLGPRSDAGDPLGGRVLLLANAEFRFPLPLLGRYQFGGAAFVDGGNVWNSVEEIGISQFRFSAGSEDVTRRDFMYGTGFGVRYYTPVGPIRLDIGFPVKKAKHMDYDYWVHISLGQIF